jgi:hypothetical protein
MMKVEIGKTHEKYCLTDGRYFRQAMAFAGNLWVRINKLETKKRSAHEIEELSSAVDEIQAFCQLARTCWQVV